MGNLGGTFNRRLEQLGIKKQVSASLIVDEAQQTINEIFGDRGQQNLRVISYKNGTLKIAASSNSWAAECKSHNQKFINNFVKKITFIITNINNF